MVKSLLVVGTLCVAVQSAAADTKSWGALKGKVPADTAILVSADVTALRSTPSFPKLVDWIKSEDKDTGAMLDLVKQTCGTDLPAMFSDVTLALSKDEKGLIVIGFNGMDQRKLLDCANKVLAVVDPKMKLSAKADGKITEYSMTGESDKLYTAWLSSDTIAVSTEKDSHAALDALVAGGGKPAGGDLGAYLSKTNTASPAWAAFSVNEDGFKGGYGVVTVGPTIKLSLRLQGQTAKDGAKGRSEAQDAMKKGVDRSKGQPDLQKVFKAVKVSGKGIDVNVDASVTEATLPALLPAFDKIF